ncbi:putative phosphoserine phosphatase [Neolecta irregularis DAH-3]|uniref:phosphoserine phosphatase n=1 Tax=Neolecta irregularis (strain DAH-3) TaxID=1198029 RepID=A0A1U7LJH1_NEOID|nr:putative phosphoserine phosphatase [Neolecta irregularis DAH-3]|eukprot:OLL22671.1 putative phosphoserine phosphatase [Neolecta irregularis DAH-3]
MKSLNISNPVPDNASFPNIIRQRLQALQRYSGEFFEILEEEVQRLEEAYKNALWAIKVKVDMASDIDPAVLDNILALEEINSLNITGIKHDCLSGLSLANIFLARAYQFTFMNPDALAELKEIFVSRLSASVPLFTSHQKMQTSQKTNGDKDIGKPNAKSDQIQASKGTFPRVSNLPIHTTSSAQRRRILISIQSDEDSHSALFHCISEYNVEIEDFTFSRFLHHVTFSVLALIESSDSRLFRDLIDAARQRGATITFDYLNPIPPIKDRETVDHLSLTNPELLMNATLLNTLGLRSKMLYDWTCLLQKYKITVLRMTRLSKSNLGCIDYQISVSSSIDLQSVRSEIYQLSRMHSTDIALQSHDVFRQHKRLVVFDMDSTLIQQEVIDEIAKFAGIKDQVATITHMAMNGEIDFTESLYCRVALLKGLPITVFEAVKNILVFTEGARELCRALKKAGIRLAVLSGGFVPLAEYVKRELNLDYAFANQLGVTADGLFLTGEVVGPIVHGERKAELLQVIAQAENISLNQVVAVGDGANDLWMLGKAGLGIAFNAKPKVQEVAPTCVNEKSLQIILYLLGYTDVEQRRLLED